MNKLFLLILMVVSFSVSGQVLRPNNLPTTNSASRFDITGYQMDSAFLYVLRDSFPAKYPSVIYHPNGSLYKSPGGVGAHWSLITDTTYLSNRINLKLNISDTANMLANYLRKADTTAMLNHYHQTFVSASFDTSSRILTLIPIVPGTSTTVIIPRGGSVNGITTVTPTRSGNIITQTADNGDVWQFSVRDADSATQGTVTVVSKADQYGFSSTISTPTSTPVIRGQVDTTLIIPYTDTLKTNGIATKSDVRALVTGVSSVTGVANQTSVSPTTGAAIVGFVTNPIVSGTLSATGLISSGNITGATAELNTAKIDSLYGSHLPGGDLTLKGTSNSDRGDSYVIIQPDSGFVVIGARTGNAKLQVSEMNGNIAIFSGGYNGIRLRDLPSYIELVAADPVGTNVYRNLALEGDTVLLKSNGSIKASVSSTLFDIVSVVRSGSLTVTNNATVGGNLTVTGTIAAGLSSVTTSSVVFYNPTSKIFTYGASSGAGTNYLTPFSGTSLTTISPYVNLSVTGTITAENLTTTNSATIGNIINTGPQTGYGDIIRLSFLSSSVNFFGSLHPPVKSAHQTNAFTFATESNDIGSANIASAYAVMVNAHTSGMRTTSAGFEGDAFNVGGGAITGQSGVIGYSRGDTGRIFSNQGGFFEADMWGDSATYHSGAVVRYLMGSGGGGYGKSTNGQGLLILSPIIGGGTVYNNYGLYIQNAGSHGLSKNFQFYTETANGPVVITQDGKIGQRTETPDAMYDMGTTLANSKILLYNDDVNTFGIGVKESQLRIHVNSINDRISFLNAQDGIAVTEIFGSGKVAIGVITPTTTLEVGGVVTMVGLSATSNATIGNNLTVTGSISSGAISVTTINASLIDGTGDFVTIDNTGRQKKRTAAETRSDIGAGTGSGTVTNVSIVTANGVSGSVATSTTTPAVTLALGAITPSSVVNSGAYTGTTISVTQLVGTSLVGTLLTASQPNITTIGTLTALTVTNSITGASGILTTLTTSSNATITGTLTSGTHYATIGTASQPNITMVGTLTAVTVSGAGNFGSLVLPGTTSQFVDGTGHLQLTSSIVGSSPFTGTTNITSTTTGANLSMTGNIVSTSAGSFAGLSVTNNATMGGNLTVTGSVNASQLVGTSVSTTNGFFTKVTATAPDGNIAALFRGTTKAIRIIPGTSEASIEGVDNTGVASYQPISVGGSTVDLKISGTSKYSMDASGNNTWTGSGSIASLAVTTTLTAGGNATITGSIDGLSYVSENPNGLFFQNKGATIGYQEMLISNTGGAFIAGVESSTGGNLVGTAPAYYGVVRGTAGIVISSNNTNTGYVQDPSNNITLLSLAGTGSRAVLADGNGTVTAPVSDRRVKQNIRPIGYGIKEIMRMNPSWFEYTAKYKNKGVGRQNGNIAQEMEKIIPEAVFTTPSTGLKGIEYSQLDAVYIKALQELQHQVNELKKEIKQLKKKK